MSLLFLANWRQPANDS